jgi:hypothetical protein
MKERWDIMSKFPMQPSLFALLVALLFSTGYLYGQDVHYNYAHGTNFSGYKTYLWAGAPSVSPKADAPKSGRAVAPPPGLPPLPDDGAASELSSLAESDQLIGEDIKRAVDEQLAQKGLTRVEKDGDLQVSYHAVVREEKGIDLMGAAWGGRGYGWWDGSLQGQTSTVPDGTLVVDLYDLARNQLVWRGDASKTIDLKKDPNKSYKNLQKAIVKLFKNYPPQTGR